MVIAFPNMVLDENFTRDQNEVTRGNCTPLAWEAAFSSPRLGSPTHVGKLAGGWVSLVSAFRQQFRPARAGHAI
jgi:hypothetical protein